MFRFQSTFIAGVAVIGWSLPGNSARGGESSEALSLKLPAFPVVYADETPPQSTSGDAARPLMGLLNQTAIGPALQNSRINIYGWIEGSYEYNFNVRNGTANVGRAFDAFENNKGYLNQFDLTFERTVATKSTTFDVGGRVDVMYGSDSRFTASSDFLDKQGSRNSFGFGTQEAWLDIPQAYVDIAIPALAGVRLRIGKFEFFKVIDPNANALYTHPYEYVQSFPYSLTGISIYTPITPAIGAEGGISRGWDQTFTNNNSAAIRGFGRVTWNFSDRSRISAAVITGPEQYHDDGHFTTAADLTFLYAPIDQFALILDTTYGHQAGAVFGEFPGTSMPPSRGAHVFTGANWYGVTGTAAYKVHETAIVNGRLEWYRDEEGYTEAFASQLNLYEATLGLSVMPMHSTAIGDNFVIRPEVRFDYCSRPFFNVDSHRHDQVTFAIDAIFNF